MRQSQLFGKTMREAPKDEVSLNAKLLERGGFVYKTMAGVYDYQPLGFRVLEKISRIIREEMNTIGGQEMCMTALQPRERWEKTGRWEALGADIMYQFKDRSDRDLGLASTHEEALAEIALRSIHSYKDLPLSLYQIQTKFRDELRAKSGLMRGREFLMKDLYSFHVDAADLNRFYSGPATRAYLAIFNRCDLDVYVTEASGGAFTKEFTHEFQVLSEAGEDTIFYCTKCRFAQNQEIASLKEETPCPKCGGAIQRGKSIEVGNIFRLGTKYSEGAGLSYTDENGKKRFVVMGSYGIGLGRLMAAVVETHHDEGGIIWPEAAAPYQIHLIEIRNPKSEIRKKISIRAEKLYKELLVKGIEVLYDERDNKTAGEKFADADLIGIPWRVVVSEKTMEKNGVEVKRRAEKAARIISMQELIHKLF